MIRRIYSVAKYLKMFVELVLTFVMVLFLANKENGILPAWLLNGFFYFPLKNHDWKAKPVCRITAVYYFKYKTNVFITFLLLSGNV